MLAAENCRENSVSVSQLANLGYEIVFKEATGRIVATGERNGGHHCVPLDDMLHVQTIYNLGSSAPGGSVFIFRLAIEDGTVYATAVVNGCGSNPLHV